MQYFPCFEFIKVCLRCLRHDLSTQVESAELVTWNQGYWSNSPPPVSGDQMPSLPGRKRRKMPRVSPGRGGDVEVSTWLVLRCEQLVSSYAKRERNHCKQPSAFPLSMREFVTSHVIHLMSIILVNFIWNIAGFRCQAGVRISRV